MSSSDPEIRELSQFEHARLRVNMYLGSPIPSTQIFPLIVEDVLTPTEVEYTPALLTYFREMLDNALDELHLCSKAGMKDLRLFVEYDEANLKFKVHDTGRGIPFDYSESLGGHQATMAVSKTRVGRNFGDRSEVAGQNGLGVAIVNYCSEQFDLQIYRNGQKFTQKFEPGSSELIVHEPVIEKAPKDWSGTIIEAKVDTRVFKDPKFPEAIVNSMLRTIAASNPNLSVIYNGEKIKTKHDIRGELLTRETFEVAIESNSGDFRFFVNHGLRQSLGYVNNIPVIQGGTHLDGFVFLLGQIVVEKLERESKKRKMYPKPSDVIDGCFIFSIAKMPAPDFDSQSKTHMVSDIWKTIETPIREFDWDQLLKKNRWFVDAIYARVEARTARKSSKRDEQRERELMKRKLANLLDCSSRDRKACSLAVFEGHSAFTSFAAFRDPKTMAGLPLRGKIANTWGVPASKLLWSETVANLVAAIGLIPGKAPDPSMLRYGQVQIFTDADFDGASIRTSLVALFYHWPQLFDQAWIEEHNGGKPFIVVAQTPIVSVEHKKTKERLYIYDEKSFTMDDYPEYKFVSRFKGLGALGEQEWRDHVKSETMIAVIDTDGELGVMLDIHFGGDADKRKALIS
jgi:DNA gyrase/topoisomerase IV subunit B